MKRVESWNDKFSHALSEARLRQMPILEVTQPDRKKPLYIVTSAPKTLLSHFAKRGIKAKQLSLSLLKTPKKKKRVSAWA